MGKAQSTRPTREFQDLTGQTFEDWFVIKRAEPLGRYTRWLCGCICKEERPVLAQNLINGKSTGCGCRKTEKQTMKMKQRGGSKLRAYRSWLSMLARCENSRHKDYPNYGGRGIVVCERWHKFENFLTDMDERPLHYSIERIDNDGPYSPENCKWATSIEQGRNKRTNKIVTFNGETRPICEWAEILHMSASKIRERLIRGWAIEKSLTLREDGRLFNVPSWVKYPKT